MKYFLRKKKWMAWVIMLTFLFTSIMPSNLLAGNSVAEAADKGTINLTIPSDMSETVSVSTYNDVTWKSNNTSVATVKGSDWNGKENTATITAIGKGTATVSAAYWKWSILGGYQEVKDTWTVKVTGNGGSSDSYNLYCYTLVPGMNLNSTAGADTMWNGMGVGAFTGAGAPSNYQPGVNVMEQGTITYPTIYPNITVQEKTYQYAEPGSENATKRGYYTIEWIRVVHSYGANTGNNDYNPVVSSKIDTYHLDGQIFINETDLYNVTFRIQQPGSNQFAIQDNYSKLVKKETAEASLSKPATPDKTYNGLTYKFDGWYYDEACTQKAAFTGKITGNTNYYGKYVPKEAAYTVEHYQQNLNSSYPTTPNETDNLTGAVGDQTKAAAKTYPGFTVQNFEQQTINADGKTVVKIYYDRKTATGAKIVKVDQNEQPLGGAAFTFNGSDLTATASTTGVVKKVANFLAGEDAVKNIFNITQTLKYGEVYEITETTTPTGYTGVASFYVTLNADATALVVCDAQGNASTVPTGVSIEGLTVTVTNGANVAKIVFEENGGSAVNDMTGVTDGTIENTSMPTTTRTGYTFGGWYDNAGLTGEAVTALPDKYPAGTTTYYAKWTANDGIKYTVEYYYQQPTGENDYKLEGSTERAGVTDTLAILLGSDKKVNITTSSAYSWNAEKTVDNQPINGDSSTTLKVYFDLGYKVVYFYRDSEESEYKALENSGYIYQKNNHILKPNAVFDGTWVTTGSAYTWNFAEDTVESKVGLFKDAFHTLYLYATGMVTPKDEGNINVTKQVVGNNTAQNYEFTLELTPEQVKGDRDLTTEEANELAIWNGKVSAKETDLADATKARDTAVDEFMKTGVTVTTDSALKFARVDEDGNVYGLFDGDVTSPSALLYDFDSVATADATLMGEIAEFINGLTVEVVNDVTELFAAVREAFSEKVDGFSLLFNAEKAQEMFAKVSAVTVAEGEYNDVVAERQAFLSSTKITKPAEVTLVAKYQDDSTQEFVLNENASDQNCYYDAASGKYIFKFTINASSTQSGWMSFDVQVASGSAINFVLKETGNGGADSTTVNNVPYTLDGVAEKVTSGSSLQYVFKNIFEDGGTTPPPVDPVDPVDPDSDPVDPPEVVIPDPEPPLVEPEEPTVDPTEPTEEITDPDVPLIDVPGEEVEIPEPEVPLGDAPKTGDTNNAVPFVVLMMAAGLGLVITRRRFN